MEEIEYLGQKMNKWECGASTFLAWPEAGARLLNWNIKLADGSVRDVIFWPEMDNLDGFFGVRGGNPILFPFSARTFDQGDIYFWRHEGVRRPMPMHGIARQGKFEVIRSAHNGFTASFLPDAEANEAYPFKYEFHVVYLFQELSVAVEMHLINRDTQPIPWSAGHHFYFQIPWHEGASWKDYRIILPAKKGWKHDQTDGHLEPQKEVSTETALDDPKILNRIHTNLKENVVRFGPKSGEEDIIMRVGSEATPAPDLTVTTWAVPGEPFFCVEPWMGPPNGPEHKKGLRYVEPGKTDIFTVEVSLA